MKRGISGKMESNMMDESSVYNSVEHLNYFLEDLEDLNHIIRSRANRSTEDKSQRLNEFVVLGRIWLDQFGQAWTLKSPWIPANAPKVMTMADFVARYGSVIGSHDFGWSGREIPHHTWKCSFCGRKWSIEDCTDLTTYENTPVHLGCYGSAVESDNLKNFIKCFVDAGFDCITYQKTVNTSGYAELTGCWFKFKTEIGEIVIGWRKRVIQISWPAIGIGRGDELKTSIRADVLFEEESTTKEYNMIHAWGGDKATEYLKKLRIAVLK